ncbi:hypothetical protein D3C87_1221480 [compost metagenome]
MKLIAGVRRRLLADLGAVGYLDTEIRWKKLSYLNAQRQIAPARRRRVSALVDR